MSTNNIVTSFCRSQFGENMKKYNEDNVNYCAMFRLRQYLVKLGNYAMRPTSVVLREKQLDLCKGDIIFCHVDCFCLQERKEKKMKPEVFFCFQD